MSNVTLNAVFGPRYEIVIANDQVSIDENFNLTLSQREPLRLQVGTLFPSPKIQLEIVAAQNIIPLKAVTINGFYADDTYEAAEKYAGVAQTSVSSGMTLKVLRTGLLQNSGLWTPNKPVFIGSNGDLTQNTSLLHLKQIGFAVTASDIFLDPSSMNLLASQNW